MNCNKGREVVDINLGSIYGKLSGAAARTGSLGK